MASEKTTVIVREVRGHTAAELDSLLASKVDELQRRAFKHALGQLGTTHELRQLRRDIARLETVINEKKRAGE
jgi:large subunit ribosomal protein L29